MPRAKTEPGILAAIETALARELKALPGLDDVQERLAILDRAIKFEALRNKITEKDDWGSAFAPGDRDGQ